MPSSKQYLEFVLEMLSDTEEISYRPMMGEYIIYCRGKVVGGIYDDRFLVKKNKICRTDDARCAAGAALRWRKRDAACGKC